MDFLRRLFGRSHESAGVAKERLQLILAQDRTNISSETLNVLKDEIIAVISQHVEIDRANVQVSMTHTNQGDQLIANIPVIAARAPAPPAAERPKRARSRRAHAARA